MADEKKPETKEWKDLVKGLDLEPGKPAGFVVRREAIPIIFVPGIMGSRLKLATGEKVWDPDAKFWMLRNYGMIWVDAADKKEALIGSEEFDPDRMVPLLDDADHNESSFGKHQGADKRGWGGVSWNTYGEILEKLSDPNTWSPAVQAFFELPVYAFGYNWSASNVDAGEKLKDFIDKVVKENDRKPPEPSCEQVVLVTHSMGGLVARSACEQGAKASVLGVIHGVQPVTGSAAAYWRMKAGFEREGSLPNPAAWVLGTNGREVTALLGHMPGGLQLLPSQHYKQNGGSAQWLRFKGHDGKELAALPKSDPYREIYENQNEGDYFRLIRKEYLLPEVNPRVTLDYAWTGCKNKLEEAKAFHEQFGLKHHPETQAFYGSGDKHRTADEVFYVLSPFGWKNVAGQAMQVALKAKAAFTFFGAAGLVAYLGYEALSHTDWWESRGDFKARIQTKDEVTLEVELQQPAGKGDGTVPESSGKALDQTGEAPGKGGPARAFAGIEHEPAYHADQRSIAEKAKDAIGGLFGKGPEKQESTVDFTVGAVENLCRLKIKQAGG